MKKNQQQKEKTFFNNRMQKTEMKPNFTEIEKS